ncbi:MAG: cytotoxin [Sulfobacillus thermosulfidooxidans]|uniref:Cytotoxin n=1 Tax=Sulfobacillus thermosulfidooxidans TaxID=28034 RepID=A0A2T2WHI7_SULTH|nr:MAG: cytotoxin [Sulfobacillus thermosulfidooxidans]
MIVNDKPIIRSKRFDRMYQRLPAVAQAAIDRAIHLHFCRRIPTRAAPLQTHAGLWELRAGPWRVTFKPMPDGIILRACGPHDRTLARP